MKPVKHYAERDIIALDEAGGFYIAHVSAMTSEKLHSKTDIAAELGHRDMLIMGLHQQNEQLKATITELSTAASNQLAELYQHQVCTKCGCGAEEPEAVALKVAVDAGLNFIERAKVVSAVKLGCLSPEDAAALRAQLDEARAEAATWEKRCVAETGALREMTDHRDALASNMAEHQRLHAELNAILHPNHDGPAMPSLCDLVSYVRSDRLGLMAKIERMQTFIRLSAKKFAGDHHVEPTMWNLLRVAKESPQQSLIDVRADDYKNGWLDGYNQEDCFIDPNREASNKSAEYMAQRCAKAGQ